MTVVRSGNVSLYSPNKLKKGNFFQSKVPDIGTQSQAILEHICVLVLLAISDNTVMF